MSDGFRVRVVVRSYEIDVNGHVNHANYHRYGEHARTEHMVAAGLDIDTMRGHDLGVVLLETHVRFLRELRHGDPVDVTSGITFGSGKTFEFAHELRRADGTGAGEVVAEITARMGLLDATARRLLPDPHERLARIATRPELLR